MDIVTTAPTGVNLPRKSKVVCLLSGGMDSGTLAYLLALDAENEVHTVSFNYGQRHGKEIEYARALARKIGATHVVFDLTAPFAIFNELAQSSLINSSVDVPEGHYAEESMKATVVPNRNMIMLSLAVAYAIALKVPYVAYAAHAGDHEIYPDCREGFVSHLSQAITQCDWEPPMLIAPFVSITKADIAHLGSVAGLDYTRTWSCYKGGEVHCGKCGTCVERDEALAFATQSGVFLDLV